MPRIVPATEELKTYLDVSFDGCESARSYILSHSDEKIAADVYSAFSGLVDFENRDVLWSVREERNKILLDLDKEKTSLLKASGFWGY